MNAHLGLVMRNGRTKQVSKARLRRFLAGDPEIMAIATTDLYAKPQ